MSAKQRKQMIEPHLREPSISRQCQLLSLSRSSFYYAPMPVSAEDLELMRLMGIEAVYPKPHTSRPHPQHRIYPYLLKGMTIDHPNQAWAADITYPRKPYQGFSRAGNPSDSGYRQQDCRFEGAR